MQNLATLLPALLLACAAAAPPAGLTTAGPGELFVRVEGASSGGTVALALYCDAASFEEGGEPLRSTRLSAGEGTVVWRLDDLPSGVCAVKAYLDADGDGELDRGAFGVPSEPYGFSGGARGRLGPPSFAAAAFRLRGERTEVEVILE